MQHGAIEAVGTHDELLSGDNSYKAMWDAMLKRDTALDRLALHADHLPELVEQEVSRAI
jgi:subfamily B ATP-binding cassette protein HlyB/CyaB